VTKASDSLLHRLSLTAVLVTRHSSLVTSIPIGLVLGILGGTFNPIHYAHLRLAEELADALSLQSVRVIPASIPPHREAPRVGATHRLAMVELACAGNPRLTVDDRECRRSGPSYTVDHAAGAARRARMKQPLCLLMGVDAFRGMTTWSRLATVCSGWRSRNRAPAWFCARGERSSASAGWSWKPEHSVDCLRLHMPPGGLVARVHASPRSTFRHRDPRQRGARTQSRVICFPTPFSIIFIAINCIRIWMQAEQLRQIAKQALDEIKAHDVIVLDPTQAHFDVRLHDRGECGFGTDRPRHCARNVAEKVKSAGGSVLGAGGRPDRRMGAGRSRRRGGSYHATCHPHYYNLEQLVGRGSSA
jgi:cytidyltransferase-like protein